MTGFSYPQSTGFKGNGWEKRDQYAQEAHPACWFL